MLACRTLLVAVAVAAAFVTLPVRSSAQKPDQFVCPRLPFESDFDWTNRCFDEQQKADTSRRVKDAELRTAYNRDRAGGPRRRLTATGRDGSAKYYSVGSTKHCATGQPCPIAVKQVQREDGLRLSRGTG